MGMIKLGFNARSQADLMALPAEERTAVFASLLESRKSNLWVDIWSKPHKERIRIGRDYVAAGWLLDPYYLLIAYVGREAELNFEQLYSHYATLSAHDYANIITCELEVDVNDPVRMTRRFESIIANFILTDYDDYLRNALEFEGGFSRGRLLARIMARFRGDKRVEILEAYQTARRLRCFPFGTKSFFSVIHDEPLPNKLPRVREDAEYFFSRRADFVLPEFPAGTPPAPSFLSP
jgi:hypothetical protein